MKTGKLGVLSAMVLMLALSGSAFAQAQAGRGQGANGQGGRNRGGNNGGNFDPAQMRQQALTRLKEQLASPDEEWKLLEPKLDKLLTVQRDNRGGRGNGRTRGGNNNNNDQAQPPAQPQSAVATASQDLRKAIDDKSSSPEDITRKLTALREAREKAKADLAAAQKDLRELLSARQEAILVTNGLLE